MSANPGGAVVKQIEVTVGNKTRVFSYDWSGGGAWVRCELPFQALSNAERIVVRSLSLSDSTFGACLDNFVIEELSCEAECAALQQALNDALAALTQATASVASLTQQLATANADKAALQQQLAQANADKAALQAQLATANASIASLQQQLTVAQSQIAQLTADKAALETQRAAAQAQVVSLQAANAALTQQLAAANALIASLQGSLEATAASLGRVQADFRTVFNDSTFTIPGATTAVQADNLATAVIGLNHGRKKGIYDALK